MKAWGIVEYGKESTLKLLELPVPLIDAGQILVRVKAAAINPIDYKIKNGEFRFVFRHKFPLILGHDLAGVVEKVGAQVTRFKIGDTVYGVRSHNERLGALAELMATKEDCLSLMPRNLSFEQAAAIPVVGLTSWQAFFIKGNLRKGERVFIAGGSGGVGSFAIQLAKKYGAHVICSTSTRNIDFVKSLGADEVIDYTQKDFSTEVSEIDVFLDTVGSKTVHSGIKTLRPGGRIISIVGPPTPDAVKELGFGRIIQFGSRFLSTRETTSARKKNACYIFLPMMPKNGSFNEITKLLEEGAIKPVLDKIIPFDKADEALTYAETKHVRGKVVVTIEGTSDEGTSDGTSS